MSTAIGNTYKFNSNDFEILDNFGDSPDNDKIRTSVIDNWIDAFQKEYNIDKAKLELIKDTADAFKTNSSYNYIDKNEFNMLLDDLKDAAKESSATPKYKFDFSDFDALDTFPGSPKNNLIGSKAIADYISELDKQYNLSDADKTRLNDLASNYIKYGYGHGISSAEFRLMLPVIRNMIKDESSEEYKFDKTDFESLDTFNNSKNDDVIETDALKNYLKKFNEKYELTADDKSTIKFIEHVFIGNGSNKKISKDSFEAIVGVLETMTPKEDDSSPFGKKFRELFGLDDDSNSISDILEGLFDSDEGEGEGEGDDDNDPWFN